MAAQTHCWLLPPMATWYRTRPGIAIWARQSPLSGEWRWRTVATSANGQPALAFYAWDEAERAYLRFALNVLTFRGRAGWVWTIWAGIMGFLFGGLFLATGSLIGPLLAHVAINVLTNYFNNVAETTLDFPAAALLEPATV